MNSGLLRAVKMFSSNVELALLIGVSPQKLDNWLNKSIKIPLEYAKVIEAATKRKVTWQELVTHKINNVMIHANTLLEGEISYSIPYIEIAINKIKIPDYYSFNKVNYSHLYEKRPICIDENNRLIFGKETLNFYNKQQLKKIPVRHLSLTHLVERRYGKNIEKIFNLLECIQIGIALEKYFGNRQGARIDLKKDNVEKGLREYFPEVKEKRTLAIIAFLIGFGNNHRKTYEQSKNVLQQGCFELLNEMNKKRIKISTAFRLSKQTHEEQQRLLNL